MTLLLVAILAIILISDKEGREQESTLQTSGSASLTVMPDQADIYLSIQTVAKTAKEAQAKNAEIANAVIHVLKKSVDEKNIQTTNYYLYEEKEYNQKTNAFESKGYRATHQLRVLTKDIPSVGKLLDDTVQAGATNIDSISFDLSEQKQKEVRKQLLSQASADARSKADMLAQALGTTVGDPVSVSESGYEPPIYYAQYAMKDAMMEATDTTIQPREVKVSTTVSVTFEID